MIITKNQYNFILKIINYYFLEYKGDEHNQNNIRFYPNKFLILIQYFLSNQKVFCYSLHKTIFWFLILTLSLILDH